jgi:hypothetical protein
VKSLRFQFKTNTSSNDKSWITDRKECARKEAAVASRGTKENHEQCDRRSPARNLNLEPAEYDEELLLIFFFKYKTSLFNGLLGMHICYAMTIYKRAICLYLLSCPKRQPPDAYSWHSSFKCFHVTIHLYTFIVAALEDFHVITKVLFPFFPCAKLPSWASHIVEGVNCRHFVTDYCTLYHVYWQLYCSVMFWVWL